MMGRQQRVQRKLFYTKINLNQRVSKDHILRKVTKHIDFDFIYKEVKDKYGSNGNVSVPPPVILKMMLLLVFYNVRSERELMGTIPVRLDWLWFLGYDLDDEIPNHSVISKARTRWGVDTLKSFFERIVWQCVQASLVDGKKLFIDSSMVQADASNNSVVNKESLKRYLNTSYQAFEARLEDHERPSDNDDEPKSGTANRKFISTTDPDASVVRRGKGASKLQYQVHRGVDEKCEIITATEVTPGEVNEARRLKSTLASHHKNTGRKADICVADSKYGTKENYLACYDFGIKAHFNSYEKTHRGSGRQKGIFPKEAFSYNPDDDTFTCPSGQTLSKRKYDKKREHYEYKASSVVCGKCHLRKKCTRSKTGRSLKRHIRQNELDIMLNHAEAPDAKRNIKTRQHLMERTFAQATRYGYQRARWRRLWRVQIQEYLTAAIQNIKILLKDVKEPAAALEMQVATEVSDKASRTKPYGLSNLFNPQWSDIARFCLTVGKNLPYHPAEIMG